MTGGVDLFLGTPPPALVVSALRRGRAVITVRPQVQGLDEVLVAEASPGHLAADWAALAARGAR